jgi:hypothetical protein
VLQSKTAASLNRRPLSLPPPQNYIASKQYTTALDNIKWVTDYFIKCVGDGTEIVGQVGNGNQDHGEGLAAGATCLM